VATLATVIAVTSAGGAVYALTAPAGAPPHRPSIGMHASGGVALTSAPRAPLTIRAQPARRTIAAGATVTYRVRISRGPRLMRPAGHSRASRRLAVLVALRVRTPLPAGVNATFRPTATRSSSALLTLRTKPSVRPGAYRVRLSASGRLGGTVRHRLAYARTSVTLVVLDPVLGGRFTIGGSLAEPLAPGRILPLDLSLTNPHSHALQITQLAVRIVAVHAPRADTAHPCSAADFAIVPFSGVYGFTLRASTTARLSTLGIPSRQRPHVAMVDRTVNQDGCKHATLSLSFTGVAVDGDE
jgi:hypothetical protein